MPRVELPQQLPKTAADTAAGLVPRRAAPPAIPNGSAQHSAQYLVANNNVVSSSVSGMKRGVGVGNQQGGGCP
jgi:hypothetical protein